MCVPICITENLAFGGSQRIPGQKTSLQHCSSQHKLKTNQGGGETDKTVTCRFEFVEKIISDSYPVPRRQAHSERLGRSLILYQRSIRR